MKRMLKCIMIFVVLVSMLAGAGAEAALDVNGMYGDNTKVELTKDVAVPGSGICSYKCEAACFDIASIEQVYGTAASTDADNTASWSLSGGTLSLSSEGRLYYTKDNADDYLNVVGYAKDADDAIISSYIVNDSPLEELSIEDATEQILAMYNSIPWPQSCADVKPVVTLTPFHTENIREVYDETQENDWWVKPLHSESVKSVIDSGSEFYYATVEFSISDIPIATEGYTMSNERSVNGCLMTFIVDADGLINMDMYEVYIPLQTAEDDSSVLTASETLQKISEFFDRIILESPVVITDMKFDYYPIATDSSNEYLLQPTWHVCLHDNDSDDVGIWIAVNAYTGEFLDL